MAEQGLPGGGGLLCASVVIHIVSLGLLVLLKELWLCDSKGSSCLTTFFF